MENEILLQHAREDGKTAQHLISAPQKKTISDLTNLVALTMLSTALVACTTNNAKNLTPRPLKIELDKASSIASAHQNIPHSDLLKSLPRLDSSSSAPFVIGPCCTLDIGIDFTGTFYDLGRNRQGLPIPCSTKTYRKVVQKLLSRDWNPLCLARFYRPDWHLYTTSFIIPPVRSSFLNSELNPESIGSSFWILHYKGLLTHHEAITFRFVGVGDDLLMIRVDGKVVLAAARTAIGKEIIETHAQAKGPEPEGRPLGNGFATASDWITLKPYETHEMELLMSDSGEEACLMLAIEEMGKTYPHTENIHPVFPAFRTWPPSSQMLERIYKHLEPGQVSLTNGPVFSDRPSH